MIAAAKAKAALDAPRRCGLAEQELRKELRGENFSGSYQANRWVGLKPGANLLIPEDYMEYRNYIERILEPLQVSEMVKMQAECNLNGRLLLHNALEIFFDRLKDYVTGCEERQFSKANLKRARSIEAQLPGECEALLPKCLEVGLMTPQDLHGIWFGFSLMRTWRSATVPQECLLAMIKGLLAALNDEEAEAWSSDALTEELTWPEVHKSMNVSAWPALCELLGRLPDFVTPEELREALWQQSFVENPTHAPDHRNYKRFAMLAAQMVTIGVELESDKVQHLVQQALYLERPWRERRDMLCGILSAASVKDRQQLVWDLDRRFEEHAELDDFEILCGISEHLGVEVPRDGAVRRTALRRWALDPKRGGALPASRLIDFVDGDSMIGEDVATDLRKKGRTADAAVLLSRLPIPEVDKLAGDECGVLDYHNGDAELQRLQSLLNQDLDDLEGNGVFGPVAEGAMQLPFQPCDGFYLAETAQDVHDAVARLKGASVLAVAFWKEEAPFWHAPVTILAICSAESIELFDLVHLRTCNINAWAEAANLIRWIISDPGVLKIGHGTDILHTFAYALSLGIAGTLKRFEREALGPLLDVQGIIARVLGTEPEDTVCKHGPVAERFLGNKVCTEEDLSNFSRRPLRASQLHHMALHAWSQIPVIRALCSFGLVPSVLLHANLRVQDKIGRGAFARHKALKTHVPGQLAPPGRLADSEIGIGAYCGSTKTTGDAGSNKLPAIRIAAVQSAVTPVWRDEKYRHVPAPELPMDTTVKVYSERLGATAIISAHDASDDFKQMIVPTSCLVALNSWEFPDWVASLPRPSETALIEAQEVVAANASAEAAKDSVARSSGSATALGATASRIKREEVAKSLLEELSSLPVAQSLLNLLCDAQND